MTKREQMLLDLGKETYQMHRYLVVDRMHMQNKDVIACTAKIKDLQRSIQEFDESAKEQVASLKKEMGM